MNVPSEAVHDPPSAFEALDWAAGILSSSGIDEARVDAEVLLRYAMGTDRARAYARWRDRLSRSEWRCYQDLIARRARREPVAYIVGTKEFMSLEFEVTPDVLIPRPETELLAELAIQSMAETRRRKPTASPITMDVGTGSGCIAVTIATRVPAATVYASDISEGALACAERNAEHHGVAERIHFRYGDVYEAFADDGLEGKVSVIVSNPPYISRAELDQLQPEITVFEPEIAYFGGDDGLLFHRKLVDGAAPFLTDPGVLCFEVGFAQAETAREMIAADGRYDIVDTLMDFAGIERVIVARVRK
jgi:release factor glutamine methyltransferase